MPTTAHSAYRAAQRATTSPRELEAYLLFRAAQQLETVVRSWEAPNRALRLSDALRYNTHLWTVFETSAREDGCPLPPALRTNILQLVRFIDRRTLETLAEPEPEKLRPLIDINRNIAMGLSTRPQVATTGADTP